MQKGCYIGVSNEIVTTSNFQSEVSMHPEIYIPISASASNLNSIANRCFLDLCIIPTFSHPTICSPGSTFRNKERWWHPRQASRYDIAKHPHREAAQYIPKGSHECSWVLLGNMDIPHEIQTPNHPLDPTETTGKSACQSCQSCSWRWTN